MLPQRQLSPDHVTCYTAYDVAVVGTVAVAVLLAPGHRNQGCLCLVWLYFKQQKTGAEMAIPIFHELREILDAGPAGDLTYLVTEFGKPFTANGFGNKFGDWVEEAGLGNIRARITQVGGTATGT